MADTKLTGLSAMTELSDSDLFYIVDVSAGESKSITLGELMTISKIKRDSERLDVIASVVSNATPIDLQEWGGGSVLLTQTHTDVFVYADLSASGDGTYVQALGHDKLPLKLQLDGTKPTTLPEEIYNYPWAKLVSTVADSGVTVFLKG